MPPLSASRQPDSRLRTRWRVVIYSILAFALILAGAWFFRARNSPEGGMHRPQEPARPLPYFEQEVSIPHPADGITLAGMFTLPSGKAPFPAVVLIPGTGPQDRDSTQFGHRPFFVLTDHLTRAGIAVLRCDRRGSGKSTGDFATATQADFATDAKVALDFLRRRSGVDPQRVGLVGHSEGGLIALRTVALVPGVAFVVLLASPGLPHADVVAGQHRAAARAHRIDPPLIEQWIETHRAYLRFVTSDDDAAAVETAIRKWWQERVLVLSAEQRKILGIGDEALDQMLALARQPGFVSAMRTDPRTLLARITCPVLAVNGGKDVQVIAADNLPAIGAALAAAGNRQATSVTLPQLNHLFQTAKSGLASEYETIEETFAPGAMVLISDWIADR